MYYEFPSPDGADECRGTGELSVETCTCSSIFFGFPDRAILTQATDRYGRPENPVMQMMHKFCAELQVGLLWNAVIVQLA